MDVITSHINADFDALASMVAARLLYPDAVIAFPETSGKGVRDFLLQSTAYLLDISFARDIPLDAITRLILVDIRQGSRIGAFARVAARDDVEVHVYDHHPSTDDDIRGTIEEVHPYGATTTIMCHQLQQRGVEVSPDEATVMMLGIYEDTGNLTFSSTTVEDFHAAAWLYGHGANLNIVADLTIKDLDAPQVQMLSDLISTATHHTVNGVDVLIARAESDEYVGDLAVLAHKLKSMLQADALMVLGEMDGKVYLVARSRIPEVNCLQAVLPFDGGGHSYAASAVLRGMTLNQAEEQLHRVLAETVVPATTAGDIMVHPAQAVPASCSLAQASEQLQRYNINMMPVLDDGQIAGIISRNIIDRARRHRLDECLVGDFMATEFSVVDVAAPLETVKAYIVEDGQRLIPVIDHGKLAGVITRTDFLRILHSESAAAQRQVDRKRSGRMKNMTAQLAEHLQAPTYALLRDIGRFAHEMGCGAYIVGGMVRDLLLGYDNEDLDVVIEGDAIAFAKRFAAAAGWKVRTHPAFGTAVIQNPAQVKVDVATARLEFYERPGALPLIEMSSIRRDLYRRDFTINTMAINLNPQQFGQLIDFFGGRRDLKERTIRVLHNLSFVEDPSRIFRAIRFEQRYGFKLGKMTRRLMETAIRQDFVSTLGGKRLGTELRLLLNESNVAGIIARMHELGLLACLNPRIALDKSLARLLAAIADVLAWYELLYRSESWERCMVYFMGLIDRLDGDAAAELVRRFELRKSLARMVTIAKEQGDAIVRRLNADDIAPSKVYHILERVPTEVCLLLMARARSTRVRRHISNYFIHFRDAHLEVTTADLFALGVSGHRRLQAVFTALREAVIDGTVTGRDEQLAFCRAFLNNR